MVPTEFDVSGQVVLVTGAGRGIGKDIAQALSEAGAHVAINALTENTSAVWRRNLARRRGRTVVPVIADVT